METFEKGSKIKNGKLSIIDLRGTWREMGRQYGALMSAELRDIDVYKRQPVYSLRDKTLIRFDLDENLRRAQDLQKSSALIPVSYTHLDVYKRQGLYNRGVFAVTDPMLPTISIGNNSFGGTNKTCLLYTSRCV